jgi:hypothetical protein
VTASMSRITPTVSGRTLSHGPSIAYARAPTQAPRRTSRAAIPG